ncbi:MAG: DUF4936 family protein [Aquabacterium sp.]|nr:DUF4936 family protein [Aquabacterium sp.]
MTRELFVYFQLDVRQADAVQAAVIDMQAQLRSEFPGLRARLLKRIDASSGSETWMETYAMAPSDSVDGVTEALSSTIEQRAAAWRDLLDGTRHVELFAACA